jgi:hypothetical protein
MAADPRLHKYEIDAAEPLPGMQKSMEYMRKAMEEINEA